MYGCFLWGIEPVRVLPLRKQCGTLFSGKRAELSKRGQSVCKAKPQQTAIPLWVTKKQSYILYGCFLWGIEPVRVLPLRKQCSTLFSGKRAERSKRGQPVCKAKPQQTAIPLWVTRIPDTWCLGFFLFIVWDSSHGKYPLATTICSAQLYKLSVTPLNEAATCHSAWRAG